ncbi:MAG: NAD(P)/FAD-dependent oxidoreductase [Methylococcales bacterium]|jgi:predicted Rossmann fold flavoprotein|nr:NAD(P)/FAD-dependent oxidoreductase [Methylococcaceae bacterium]
MIQVDVVVIGAGAAGLMCASEAGKRGRKVVVLDHANKAGKKILMSGGGRCNFTNYSIEAENFISNNPHFCKSALSRFTQWDFLGWVDRYDIPFHERSHGQLFCNDSAKDILNMLLSECEKTQVEIRLNCNVQGIKQLADNQFQINTDKQSFQCQSLVIATGGLSIPKMGASAFGYQVAEQFGIPVIPVRAALVPFTLQTAEKQKYSALSGVAVAAEVICKNQSFKENVLFTHRGLSGPVMLQISSYWQAGEAIAVNFLPDLDVVELLQQKRADNVKHQIKNSLAEYLPKRLVEALLDQKYWAISMQDISNQQIDDIARAIQYWQIKPNGTEGYRTAEVTLGGVDCSSISSKTMQSNEITGLYFIGEVLDVTGWLGGYNFQWAWSSGWCAGQYV